MLKHNRLTESPSAGADAFDALTDLFLGEVTADPIPGCTNSAVVAPGPAPVQASPQPLSTLAVDPPAPVGTDRGGPTIELMLLGHLPLMGSAWAGQYVRHIAAREQSGVCIVRLGVGQVRLDYVDGAGGGRELPRPAASFDEAIRGAVRSAARIVVQVRSGDDEPPRGCELCDRVTLLTSGDQVAVIAAYRLLKRLAGVITAAAPANGQATIGVAAMGCDESRAASMWRQLQEAGQSFLGVHIEPAGCIERIDCGPGSIVLFDGPWAGTLEDVVDRVDAAAEVDPAGLESVTVKAPSGPLEALEAVSAKVAEVVASATPRAIIVPPVQQATVQAPAAVDAAPDVPSTPQVQAPLRTVEPVATAPLAEPASPARSPSLSQPASGDAADLTKLVGGAVAMAARCPFDERVQLAVDPSGRLILLLADGQAPVEHACARLTAAAGWAMLNARLLALTLDGGTPLDASKSPEMHLFTSSPAAARRLLDSPVRVHVMLPTCCQVDGWVCASLN